MLDVQSSSYCSCIYYILVCSIRIELRDEWRLENRRAFANIWSDMVYGISLFILIYSNKSKVSLPLKCPTNYFLSFFSEIHVPIITTDVMHLFV